MSAGRDRADELTDAVLKARADGQPVVIAGSGSKSFLAAAAAGADSGRLLSTLEHSGLVEYRPEELVVTVRSGTPLKELRQTLARSSQMLPFEPPEFHRLGTIGGAVACGLSGPGRPWRGGVRDAVLGVEMVNGLGERLSFGGKVMKNVAGYDLARLQTGAFGTLGLILSVSLKVLPTPACEVTLAFELDRQAALAQMRAWARRPLPITASCWMDGALHLRLSGAEPAVLAAREALGGQTINETGFWSGLRDQEADFFRRTQRPVVRLVPPAAPVQPDDAVIEWSGARRWGAGDAADIAGARPFGPGYARAACRQEGGDPRLADYQARLKAAFDPENLLNPGLGDADVAA